MRTLPDERFYHCRGICCTARVRSARTRCSRPHSKMSPMEGRPDGRRTRPEPSFLTHLGNIGRLQAWRSYRPPTAYAPCQKAFQTCLSMSFSHLRIVIFQRETIGSSTTSPEAHRNRRGCPFSRANLLASATFATASSRRL
jgi:hypothetical protein